MAGGFNQVILLGRLGSDPEARYTQGGTTVASFGLATSRWKKGADGGPGEEQTIWHRCKAFGKAADVLIEHSKKGDLLFVEGRLDYWEAEGQRGKLMVAEVIVEHFEFAGGSARSGGGERAPRDNDSAPRGNAPSRGAAPRTGAAVPRGSAPRGPATPSDPFPDDDIPF